MGGELRRRSIVYVAPMDAGNTSAYRFAALQRLGQEVSAFPLEPQLPRSFYLREFQFRYPFTAIVQGINEALLRAIDAQQPDVVWFDKPTYFTPRTIREIKERGCQLVCFNQDNPFGPRKDDGWRQFLRVYRQFDLHCVLRAADVARYTAWGLPFVKILFSYEPTQHFAPPAGWSDADRDREVAYTGSPLEERPAFLARLGDEFALPLTVAGPRWKRAWPKRLRDKFLTGGMMEDAAYRETIWRSKVNLAFLTHANEDDIAHKAVEIAACGQFLLAERVPGHQACFEEDREAVFFGSVEECAEKARYYLAHEQARKRIAAAGRLRAERSGYSNDAQLTKVLERLDGLVDGSE